MKNTKDKFNAEGSFGTVFIEGHYVIVYRGIGQLIGAELKRFEKDKLSQTESS